MSDQPSNLLGDYARLLSVFAKHEVEFVVCRGLACILQGIPRVTANVDILVRLSEPNLRKLVAAAKELRLQPRVPEPLEAILDEQKRRDWIERKNAKVFTLVSMESPLQADIFLDYPLEFDEVWRDADTSNIEDLRFRVSSKEHLIAAKQAVQPPRETDLRDIHDLQELIKRDQ